MDAAETVVAPTDAAEVVAAPASGLAIALLGGFRVTVAGRVVAEEDWPLRKARGLVKLLALAPGGRLLREQVYDRLWPELAAPAADNNLRGALHQARHALAPVGRIVARGGALVLEATGTLTIDSVAFVAAAAEAERGRTADAHRRALDLYTGELLPDELYEDWTIAARDTLRARYLTLLTGLAALQEVAGDWSAAIVALQRVLLAEPTHEGAHLGLMRLYALAGRRARALRQWEELRDALRRDLDAAPDPAADALREAIAAGRFPPPTADAADAAAAARDEGAVAGRRARERTNLPVALTPLIGREEESRAVRGALAGARLLTLTGAGGCGKTRLALAVATDLLASYRDGVWLVELAALTDAALVPQAVAAAFGVREEAGTPLTATLGAALRARTALIVLDNAEHLRAACAALVAALLAAAPGLRVLATSRAPLGVPGEVAWRVPSLAVPGVVPGVVPGEVPGAGAATDPRALAALGEVAAVRLFVARARERQPGFGLTPQNAATVAEVCRRLDGIPLALELAAARLAILPIAQLAGRLDDALRLLTGGGRAMAERQQTLRATLDWSYALLSPAQRTLLRHCGVFAGGFALEALEAVCGGGVGVPGGGEGLLDDLTGLAEHALVQVELLAEPEARYRLLETVRQYAAERLVEAGEGDALHERHAAHYLALAETSAPHFASGVPAPWLARLEREHDNLRRALAWSIGRGETDRALRLVGSLWRLWYFGGAVGEGRRWCAATLALPADPADEALAGPLALALHGAGRLAYLQGDHVAALAFVERGLAIQRRRGDEREIAALLLTRSAIAIGQHRYDEARVDAEGSLALGRLLDDRNGMAGALNSLGLVATYRGAYPRAREYYEEALALHRDLGNDLRIALVLNNLAEVIEYAGDLPRAEAMYGESLDIYRALGNTEGMAMANDNLGVTLRGRGEYTRAVAHQEAGAALWRELGNRWRTALALTNLGATLYHLGGYDRALALHEESLGLFRLLDNAWGGALALENLGRLCWARGDRERAVAQLTESLARYRQLDNSGGLIAVLCDLGRVAREVGDRDRALAQYGEALARCARTHDRSRLPAPLEGLAATLADAGRAVEAARLLGAADALRAALGKPRPPAEMVAHTALLGVLCATLGEAACAVAAVAGRALAPDAALAFALALAPVAVQDA